MTKKLINSFEFLFFILLLGFALVFAFGIDLSYATVDGIKLWAACVLPALFPYFFITAILSALSITGKFSKLLSPFTQKVFNTGGLSGFAFFISLISGYPVGAKTVSDLRNKNLLSSTEAIRCSCFCSTTSPLFAIGSVGSVMFNSKHFGLCLYLTHFISAIIVGFVFSFYKRKERATDTNMSLNSAHVNNILYESVYSAVISILVVGGLITVFYILTEALVKLNALTPLINLLTNIIGDGDIAKSLVFGVFECTRALKVLSTSSTTLALPITCAICGFGGLSVIVQSISYLKTANIKTAPFILSKIISAVINFVIGFVVSILFL